MNVSSLLGGNECCAVVGATNRKQLFATINTTVFSSCGDPTMSQRHYSPSVICFGYIFLRQFGKLALETVNITDSQQVYVYSNVSPVTWLNKVPSMT